MRSPPDHGLAARLLGAIRGGLAALLLSGPAIAQFVPGERDRLAPPERRDAPCVEQVATPLVAENGIARLRIVSPCRQGRVLEIQTTEATFEARFDASGVLAASVPVFRDLAPVRWSEPDGRMREEQVRLTGSQRVLKVALIWRGDVALSLRVDELAAGLPNASCQWFRRDDSCRGLGRFDTSAGAGPGTHFEIYTLPQPEIARVGRLPYRVYFDSQVDAGGRANPAYCGDGPWAEPTFTVWVLKGGALTRESRLGGFRRAPCERVGGEPTYGRGDVLLGP